MNQTSYSRLDSDTPPEIYTADLSELILLAATWSDLSDLNFIDPLPEPGVQAGIKLLHDLGALRDGVLTELGRQLADLPVHPRHGRALIDTSPRVGSRLATNVVALLEEEPSGDLEAELRTMLRRPTQSFTASQQRLSRLIPPQAGSGGAIGEVVAAAYPDRIARKRGQSYVTTSGIGATLLPGSPLEGSTWLAVADLRDTGRTDMLIGAAVPIAAEIAYASGNLKTETTYALTDRLRATTQTSLGVIEISKEPGQIDRETGRAFLLSQLAQGFPASAWTPEATHLADRLNFLARTMGEPFAEITDAYLAREDVLEPELSTWVTGAKITIPLEQILRRCIPWEYANELDSLAPVTFTVPSGRDVRVHYDANQPYVSVKLQECFGLNESPLISGVPLQFHLLSPAGRPLAVTSDLKSFWEGPYRGVRSDMRGRYPKHPWPDDPTTAIPTAKTKRHQ